MAQKFFVPVTIQDLSSTGSDAISVFIDNESYARLKLEGGGRLVWGDGTGAGDVNLYRDSANVLKTDDKFVTARELVSAWSSGDEGGEIQLALPQTNTTLSSGVTIDVYQNRLRFFENGGSARGAYIDLTAAATGASTNLLSGGGATALDGLTDVTAPSPSSGDFLKYNGTAWVNDPINLGTDTTGDYVSSLVAGTGISLANNSGEGATPTISSVGARVSDSPPSSPVTGQIWYESDTGKLFVYADSFWVEVGAGGISTQPGLVLVKSQTIGSGVSSVTVTNAFSADYDNYLIQISGGVGSTNVEISLRLGASTTNYKTSIIYTTYTSATPLAIVANAGSSFQYIGRATTSTLTMSCEVRGPNLAKPTYVTTNYVAEDATGTSNGIHTDSTQHTDFTIFPQLGTLTGGTIRVYGYRN